MKKIILFISLIILLMLTLTCSASEEEWTTFYSEDEMEGTIMWFAQSPAVESTKKMQFPYSDTKVRVIVGYDGEKEWCYLSFNNSPNLVNTINGDGRDIINTRVKWDEDIEDVRLIQEWNSRFVHFSNGDKIIPKIKKSNTALLELTWHRQGEVYFKIPLKGSSAAIDKLHNKFND